MLEKNIFYLTRTYTDVEYCYAGKTYVKNYLYEEYWTGLKLE